MKKRKVRILYINPTGDLYGASRVLLRVLTLLDREIYRPIVVLPEDGTLADALRNQKIAVKIIPYLSVIRRRIFRSWRIIPFLLFIIPSILHVWWLILRNRIDLVHTNSGVVFTSAISARLALVPHVWHLHEMFSEEFPGVWHYFRILILRFSTKILCVSTVIAQQFPKELKVHVLHNGLDLNHFSADSREVAIWRQRYGDESGDITLIGVVGRISPRKGQDVLIQALSSLKKEAGSDKLRLLIIGDVFEGNEYLLDELQELVKSRNLTDSVVFTGFIKNPEAIIAALDILVLPSILPEAFPTVVLEAMALRVPVVATNLGGTVEQIEDKSTGMLVPPRDAEALAKAIRMVLVDPNLRERLRREGRQQVEQRFNLRVMCARLEKYYQELI
jgi:glycosyltransferase involved in cell wall biosynthesis